MRNLSTDDKIRLSWSINCALQYLNGKEKTMELVHEAASLFLRLFDEMVEELPQEVCRSCGGAASITTDGIKEAIINGLHPSCRKSEGYKRQNL